MRTLAIAAAAVAAVLAARHFGVLDKIASAASGSKSKFGGLDDARRKEYAAQGLHLRPDVPVGGGGRVTITSHGKTTP